MPSNLIQCVRICLNTPYMHHVRKMNVSKVWVCVCGWMDEKVGEWIGSGGGNVPPNKHTWSRWVSDWMQERGAVIPAVSRSPDSPPLERQLGNFHNKFNAPFPIWQKHEWSGWFLKWVPTSEISELSFHSEETKCEAHKTTNNSPNLKNGEKKKNFFLFNILLDLIPFHFHGGCLCLGGKPRWFLKRL